MNNSNKTLIEAISPAIEKPMLSTDWLASSDVLPRKGVKVRCKLSKDIGLGTTEKILYRMKHNGKWNDYHHLVTHWKPI